MSGLSCLGLIACGAVIPALPSQGGPAWIELSSAHFTMWTDAPAERRGQLMRELEQRWQVITTAMNHEPVKAKVFVIAVASQREANAYLSGKAIAVATAPDVPPFQPTILLAADALDIDHVASHELAHAISYSIVPTQPAWLSEGIATYFELADLDQGSHAVQIGIPRVDRRQYLKDQPPRASAEVFACAGVDCRDDGFYATSWLIFSYLLNQRFAQLSRYLGALNAEPDARHKDLWPTAFPDLPPARLDAEITSWLHAGRIRLPRIEVATQDYPMTERPLADADVLAVRAMLTLVIRRDVPDARALAQAALARDRTQIIALLLELGIARDVSIEDARASTVAHPGDWRTWALAATILQSGPEAQAAHDRACQLADVQVMLKHCERADTRASQ